VKCRHCNAPFRSHSEACEFCGVLRLLHKPDQIDDVLFGNTLFAGTSSLCSAIYTGAAQWKKRIV
jgi:hypothetical protein